LWLKVGGNCFTLANFFILAATTTHLQGLKQTGWVESVYSFNLFDRLFDLLKKGLLEAKSLYGRNYLARARMLPDQGS
jgi:hypothetical protein